MVAYEGEAFAVRGPGGDVDGALAAEKFGENGDLAVGEGHEAEDDIFVGRVADDGFVEGDDGHKFAVGRDVGKPVVVFVVGDLFLRGAIGMHAPDLHLTGADGIEVDKLAVGRIFGAVIETFGGS